jgi:hypothetical protein
VSDPLARFARVSPSRGGDYAGNVRDLFSPSVRGRAAEGGRGSLTHHLRQAAERRKILSPLTGLIRATKLFHGLRPCLHSSAAPRLVDNFMHATQRVEATDKFTWTKLAGMNDTFHHLSTP